MDYLNKVAKAYAAGSGGALVFMIVFTILNEAGIVPDRGFPEFWYKQLVWGGIWGFVFLAPVLVGKWWLRGLIVGALASLAAIFIFGQGIGNLPIQVVVVIFVLNCGFWGLPAGYLNDQALDNA